MNIEKSLVKGVMPKKNGEAIIGDDFAKKLKTNNYKLVTTGHSLGGGCSQIFSYF